MSSTSTSHKSNEEVKISALFDVSKFTAVVTGGGTGIGLMIAQALSSNGAKVYITGRRSEALDAVVKQYSPSNGGKLIALPGDITSKSECIRLAKEVSADVGSAGLQLLVNNAGIACDDHTRFDKNSPPSDFDSSAESISRHLLQSEFSDWTDTFTTNITAGYFLSAAFLPLLAKGHAALPGHTSSVVNITSISGVMKGSSGGQFAYATSKAGMIHLSRVLATTFVGTKVRVNQIAPGIFPSEMTAGDSDETQKSSLGAESGNPVGRPGSDTDMAACILFLAGPGGVFLNNQILFPDGGNILTQPAAV